MNTETIGLINESHLGIHVAPSTELQNSCVDVDLHEDSPLAATLFRL